MASKSHLFGWGAAVSLLVVGAIWWGTTRPPRTSEIPPPSPPEIPQEASTPDTPPDDPTRDPLSQLRAHQSPAAAGEYLQQLKAHLLGLPAEEAAHWITTQLDHGDDGATGLEFTLAADGSLTTWPSFRVFLLDVLRAVDPTAAADAGRQQLQSPTTADEWAVALRNVGSGPDAEADTDLLKAKMRELLAHDAWAADPSTGYLEAFDVIVHAKDTTLLPDLLARCADQDRKAVRHASFLTLDRLVQAAPAAMLEQLAAADAIPPENALMLSNMVARADVREDAQRQAVETYLLAPQRTPAELQAFAGVFPNANQFVSRNLLTPQHTPDGADLAARDRATLETLTQWLDDPRFEDLRPHLERAAERLRDFVR